MSRHKLQCRSWCAAVSGLVIGGTALPAYAQHNVGGIEEVVVTARKREESIQETPVAVSAFTGEALEFRGVNSIDRVATFTPNLVLSKSPTNGGVSSNAQVYIRGIGQNDFVPVIDPGVGIYVDGVYLGRSVGAVLDMVDIERVEVLRGPQGTLFGRNTIGGAVTLFTRKPDDKFGGNVDVRFGTDSRLNIRGAVNVPVTDNFFMRFAAASFRQDGYVTRTFDNKDLGDDDTVAARASARWLPNEDITVDASFEYSRDRENGAAVVVTGIQPVPVSWHLVPAGPGFAPAPGTDSMSSTQNTLFSSLGPFISPDVCVQPANATTPGCYNQQYINTDRSTTLGTSPNFANLDSWAGTLNIEWEFNDRLTARSITAYRTFEGEFDVDQDGSPLGISRTLDIYQHHQISQEIQLLGNLFDGRLEWILGGYYFQEDGKNINPVFFTAVELQSGGFYDNDSWAVFGHGTYDITDKLALTVGVRYSEDSKDYLPDQFVTRDPIQELLEPILGFDPTPFDVGTRALPFEHVKETTKEAVPMVNLAYTWMDGFMTYFTYSEGFKSGGFTQRIFPPEPSLPSFDPEFVTSYEVGFKYDGFDNRVRLNAAGYFTDYTDLQLLVADPSRVGPFVTNAGDAEIWGIELELALVPAEGWLITASGGLTDADRTKLAGGVQGLTLDSRFEHISKWMGNAQIEKEFALGDWGYVTPRFEWSYRSGYGTNSNNVPRDGAPVGVAPPPSAPPGSFNPFQGTNLSLGVPNPALFQPGYSLFNASIRWDVKDSGFAIAGGVDNLTDKNYRAFGNFQESFAMTNEVFARGREWYINFSYNF